ncbi:MAG TPA: TIM barrel protein [bacterium]|nr:TIM barrel protein [bacterium]
MQEPWSRYLRLGIVHSMAYPAVMKGDGPYVETLRELASDPFFTAVEVGWVHDAEQRRQAAVLLAEAHLDVVFGAQSALLTTKSDLNAADEKARQSAVALVRGCIDQAVDLGARRVAVLSGPYPGPAGLARAVDRLVESLREICAYGRGRGVGIALETFDRTIEKRALAGPTPLCVAISERVRETAPEFGLMLDLSHLPLLGERTRDALVAARDHLVHAHIGNCAVRDRAHPAYGDVHPRFGIEGGENDTPEVLEFLRVLFEIGYLGGAGARPFLSFEVKPLPGEATATVVAGTKRVFTDAWALL